MCINQDIDAVYPGEQSGSTAGIALNFNQRYQEALKYFNADAGYDIGEVVTKDKFVYCYENEKDIIDFDFWVQYEELLGEAISYNEYIAIDRDFDGDPHDVESDDVDTIFGWRESLMNSRRW